VRLKLAASIQSGGGRYAEVEGIQALEKRERDARSHPWALVSKTEKRTI
jgi:hypothetical protein